MQADQAQDRASPGDDHVDRGTVSQPTQPHEGMVTRKKSTKSKIVSQPAKQNFTMQVDEGQDKPMQGVGQVDARKVARKGSTKDKFEYNGPMTSSSTKRDKSRERVGESPNPNCDEHDCDNADHALMMSVDNRRARKQYRARTINVDPVSMVHPGIMLRRQNRRRETNTGAPRAE
jgi:hypothetical protein